MWYLCIASLLPGLLRELWVVVDKVRLDPVVSVSAKVLGAGTAVDLLDTEARHALPISKER